MAQGVFWGAKMTEGGSAYFLAFSYFLGFGKSLIFGW